MMDLLIINPSIYWLDWLRTVFESEGLNEEVYKLWSLSFLTSRLSDIENLCFLLYFNCINFVFFYINAYYV